MAILVKWRISWRRNFRHMCSSVQENKSR